MARCALRHALVLAATAALALAAPALTSTRAAAAPATANAVIRGAHFSPDTPGVDVYLTAFSGGTSALWLTDVGYGDVSPYRAIASGLYAVSMRPHGAAASTPPALSWTLDAKPGAAYTAAAVGMNSQLHGIVLSDQLTPPAPGTGLVRVIQAASRAAHADVVAVGGQVVAQDAAFATSSPYRTVPAGTWPVTARAVGGTNLSTTANVSIASGSIDTIVLLDAKGSGLTLRTIVDAAGAALAPTGPIQTGGGGTAGSSSPPAALAALALAIAGLGAAVFVRGRRRSARM
jgi:Domain of unknown function (DUF4397)